MSQRTVKCTFTWDPLIEGYHIACPYAPRFIDLIKATVPGSGRSFDSSTKKWFIEEAYFDKLHEAAKLIFGQIMVSATTRASYESTNHTKSGQSSNQNTNRFVSPTTMSRIPAIRFLELIGPDIAKIAYRSASITLHPDKGGNPEKMAELNGVWSELQKTIFLATTKS